MTPIGEVITEIYRAAIERSRGQAKPEEALRQFRLLRADARAHRLVGLTATAIELDKVADRFAVIYALPPEGV